MSERKMLKRDVSKARIKQLEKGYDELRTLLRRTQEQFEQERDAKEKRIEELEAEVERLRTEYRELLSEVASGRKGYCGDRAITTTQFNQSKIEARFKALKAGGK